MHPAEDSRRPTGPPQHRHRQHRRHTLIRRPPAAMLPPTPALLLLALAAVARAADKPVPSYIHVCKGNDPELEKCIKNSVESLRPKLATGMPEIQVPSLEPLYLKQLVLNQNPNMHVVANDIKAYGVTSFILYNLKVNKDKTLFNLDLKFPKLNIVGTYTVDGRILLLPVRGSGPLDLNVTDVTAHADLFTNTKQGDDGEAYFVLDKLDVDIQEVKKATIRLDNLFGGDGILGEVVNSAVNANWAMVLEELKPSVEHALEETLMEIADRLLSQYPKRQIFPEQ